MINSSLGFHTIMLSLSLTVRCCTHIIHDFKKYSKKNGTIKIYKIPSSKHNSCITNIIYFPDDVGIRWQICPTPVNCNSPAYMLYAIINPKILSGNRSYLTAASLEDMNIAILNFNKECKRISRYLEAFQYYKITRADYCINFHLQELSAGCTSEQMIELIQRGNIPPHYKEYMEYDSKSHRKKRKPGSFYLTTSSVTINCYSKYLQLLDRSMKNRDHGYAPVPQSTLDAAKEILRFEVQCKYSKMYQLTSSAPESSSFDRSKWPALLSRETCYNIISSYYNKVIGIGDWYSLSNAIQKIKSHGFHSSRENRLINTLKIVNQCRSIARAKEQCCISDLPAFKQTLKELSSTLNINPVTIPQSWGIEYIPNIFQRYMVMYADELNKPLL